MIRKTVLTVQRFKRKQKRKTVPYHFLYSKVDVGGAEVRVLERAGGS